MVTPQNLYPQRDPSFTALSLANSSKAGMTHLPSEILHLIISQVALSRNYNREEKTYHKDLNTLRSLRLASQQLSEVASEYLFEELILFFTEASYAKMMAVARHPTYSSYVQSLGISPKAIFGPFLDKEAFGKWLCGERWYIIGDDYRIGRPLCIQELLECSPMERFGIVDCHHAQYTSLYNKQERLSDKAGDLLKTAVCCFSRLEKVTSAVRTPETVYDSFTKVASTRRLWQEAACFIVYDLDYSAMILTAASQFRSVAGTQIDISDAFCEMDNMVMVLPEFTSSDQTKAFFASVKKLRFPILSLDFSRPRQFFMTDKYNRFLGSMDALESLECSTFRLMSFLFPSLPSISDIFSDITWQHLRCLNLGLFHSCHNELSDLFRRHRSTLQELSMQHILLRHGSWREVFTELRGSAIKVVKAYHLGFNKYCRFHFLENAVELQPEQMPSIAPLNLFLFQGRPWVSYMEKELEHSDYRRY